MNRHEIPRLLRYLKANGAWVELDDDAEDAWAHALRNFDAQAVKAGVLWFLERNHPREIAPATIAAAVRSLLASGRISERACPDHPQEIARACRCCLADVLTGDRPRELVGQPLAELSPGSREKPAAIAADTADDHSRGAARVIQGSPGAGRPTPTPGPVSGPADLRAMDPARWDRLRAQGAAERSQALADGQNPSGDLPGAPGATSGPLREAS